MNFSIFRLISGGSLALNSFCDIKIHVHGDTEEELLYHNQCSFHADLSLNEPHNDLAARLIIRRSS